MKKCLGCGFLMLVAGLWTIPAIKAQQSVRSPTDERQGSGQEWPAGGGDSGATRYSKLTEINTGNIKNLGAAWVSKNFEEAATSRVTPVMKDGMLFTTAGAHVYALNAKTGERVDVAPTGVIIPAAGLRSFRTFNG